MTGIDDKLLLLMARERIAARGREIAERAFSKFMGRPASTSPIIQDSQ
ncbi:MAG TPA: hypothetical protein VF499_12650 [Afipia sp.]